MKLNKNQPITVSCPTCKSSVKWNNNNEFRPFCSRRCQLIDLGAWANEEHVIPGEDVSIAPPYEPDSTNNPTLQ